MNSNAPTRSLPPASLHKANPDILRSKAAGTPHPPQSAFSDDGLAVGAGLEDLGKGLRSQVGTMYATKEKGVRYLEMAEGYVTGIALDEDNEVIGYQFVSLGKMTDFIKKGDDPNTAWEKAKGQYGRVADAVKIIDPRKE